MYSNLKTVAVFAVKHEQNKIRGVERNNDGKELKKCIKNTYYF
jgi:hypothetical protein